MSFISADLGTTNCKVALLDKHGVVIKSFYAGVTSYEDEPGHHEQDAEEVFIIFINLLKQAFDYNKNEPVQFVTFSCAMHSLLAVNAEGKPLMRAITWADTRSSVWAEKIKSSRAGATIFKNTGTPIHTMSPLVKLVWMKHESRKIHAAAFKFISIKEYIFLQLFDKYILDYSIASATGLFDIYKLKYYKPSLQMAGISSKKLSQLVPPTHIETLSPTMQQKLALDYHVPFVMGASDGCLANLGNLMLSKQRASVTVGTSAAVRITDQQPVYDNQQRLFSYVLDKNLFVTGGALNNGGVALEWFIEKVLNEQTNHMVDDINKCISQAMKLPAGAEGLIFLPYLLGERAPMWDGKARGSFIGLLSVHSSAHMARAILEGIAFAINQVLAALEEVSGKVKEIDLNGGLSASEEWSQLFCNITGKKVVVNEASEASLKGAYYMGLKAIGNIKKYSSLTASTKHEKVFKPIKKEHLYYSKIQKIYNDLYPALKNSFHQLYALPKQ